MKKKNNNNNDYHQTLFFSRQIYWQLKSRSIYTIITRDLDIFHIYAILHYYEVIFVGDKTKKNNFKISERVGCRGRQWNTFMIALPLDKESLECRCTRKMLFQNSFWGMGGISGYQLVVRLLKVLKYFSSLEVVIFIF